MILVTGATGQIGGEVARLLAQGGYRVRVLARDPAKAAKLGQSVQVARGDLTAPETLDAALAGVERAFLLAHANDLGPITRHFVAAARKAGVRHVVLNSSSTIELETSNQIGRWHLEAEEALKASGLAWTMLRPGNFASNSLRWAPTIRAQGTVFAPEGAGHSGVIDPRDIAAVAARALASAGHEGKTYFLTGPEAITTAEQVEQLGRAIGKSLRLVEVPEAGARAGMLKAGMPEVFADAILEVVRAGRGAVGAKVTTTVRDVTGREARTFEEWARDHAHEFV